jgi:hypothetical protein
MGWDGGQGGRTALGRHDIVCCGEGACSCVVDGQRVRGGGRALYG